MASQKQPPGVFCKERFLRNFTKSTGKQLCQSVFFNETLAQVFSYELCQIFKNTFFIEYLRVTASEIIKCVCSTSKQIQNHLWKEQKPCIIII